MGAYSALWLKPQAISTHSAEWIFIVLDQFHMEILKLFRATLRNKITFKKIDPLA